MARRVLGGLVALVVAAACSDQGGHPPAPGEKSAEPPAPQVAPPQLRPLHPRAPRPPARTPELPLTGARDHDGNRLDDVLDQRLTAAQADAKLLADTVPVQVILSQPLEQGDVDDFVAAGGRVRYVFRELSYGFTGELPLSALEPFAARLGSRLHLVSAPSVVVSHLDEATRTGRIRGIWAASFAGNPAGYSGNGNITVAVLDTGVDGTHTDLAGRMQGFQDYTSDGSVTAHDMEGHGTHVASIAVGSGAAFGNGAGSLKFTQSGDLTGVGSGQFLGATIHTPAYLGSGVALTASATATFSGNASTGLYLLSTVDGGGPFNQFAAISGPSQLALNNKNGGSTDAIFQAALTQSNPAKVTTFAVNSTVANYPAVGDGFNTLRGVAPSCKWFGAKVFTDAGTGDSFDIETALDDVVARRVADKLKIANMSLGITGAPTDTVLRAKVNTTVDAGIVVVVSAGNSGPGGTMTDPARASKVITVAAANDVNELTTYSSIGPAAPGADEDVKPDVVAPGGSFYRSGILAADSNTTDAGLTDLVGNDYSSLQGTSMASPFVAGSVALLVDALQQSGTAWSFGSSAQPLFLKMLLQASATELNLGREQGNGNSPALGRAAAPKDRAEGSGIINPDAAIEAMLQAFVSPLNGSVSNTPPARLEWERRAWGRKMSLVNGATVILNLAVPDTADYDLYLYSGSADAKGNPLIRASSTNAGVGSAETISFTSGASETAYVFVKRVSGFGAFSLTGSAVSHCGDGNLDPGELCDPGIAGSATCCSATCANVTNGTSCSDGDACTKADSCQAGSCSAGAAVVCKASDQCHDVGSCNPLNGACANPSKPNGASCDDGDKCTAGDSCQAGACSAGVAAVCPAPDQCHTAGSCVPATGVCTTPQKANGTGCNDNDQCTQTDTCQAGACSGGNPVTCALPDQCHSAGVCNPANGVCSNPQKANGSVCDDANKCTANDTCQAGNCTGGAATVCTALDVCHIVGSCKPSTGLCSNPLQGEGFACNDNDGCTQVDTCKSGVCTGSNPVTCSPLDQCHSAGACNKANGACSNPSKADGAACDDGSLCTTKDSCVAGACKGASPVLCSPLDQCHSAGVCDPASGSCSNPAKANGAACTDGNFCTQADSCIGVLG